MHICLTLFLAAALCASTNAISITYPNQNDSEIPIWPETLLQWTWDTGDPSTVDVVIRFSYSPGASIFNYTYQHSFPAAQRSTTIPWIPLGLDVGTICELGLTYPGNFDAVFARTGPFQLVKANSGAPSASNYPPTIYTTTSASTVYAMTSSIAPINTGWFTTSNQTTITTTTFLVITCTVTSALGTSTSTLSPSNTAPTTLESTVTVSPVPAVSWANVTTIHESITTTVVLQLTKNVTLASLPGYYTSNDSPTSLSHEASTAVPPAHPTDTSSASSVLDVSFSPASYSNAAATISASSLISSGSTDTTCTHVADPTLSSSTLNGTGTAAIDTGHGSITSPPYSTYTAPTSVNISAVDSTLGISVSVMNPSGNTITTTTTTSSASIPQQTGAANRMSDFLSLQNATALYITGLSILACFAFMMGAGI